MRELEGRRIRAGIPTECAQISTFHSFARGVSTEMVKRVTGKWPVMENAATKKRYTAEYCPSKTKDKSGDIGAATPQASLSQKAKMDEQLSWSLRRFTVKLVRAAGTKPLAILLSPQDPDPSISLFKRLHPLSFFNRPSWPNRPVSALTLLACLPSAKPSCSNW